MSATPSNPEIGQSITAAGIRTNYHDSGGAGAPVLLIHGSGPGVSAWANWRLVMPALAQQARVIAPDMVGFGYTERPQGFVYSMDAWVRQAGRPIELRGDAAWISRSDLRTLLTWAGTPGLKLTLWWLGAHYQVVFDAGEDGTRAVESRPVFAYSDITDDELHTSLVLRFLTVE